MHFVLLFHTYSISCSTALFVLVKLKMILLCHTHVQQHIQMHSYRTTFRYGGKFKDGWENRYKLRCSQVLFAYTVSCMCVPVLPHKWERGKSADHTEWSIIRTESLLTLVVYQMVPLQHQWMWLILLFFWHTTQIFSSYLIDTHAFL